MTKIIALLICLQFTPLVIQSQTDSLSLKSDQDMLSLSILEREDLDKLFRKNLDAGIALGKLFPDSGLVHVEKALELSQLSNNAAQRIEALILKSQFEFWLLGYEESHETILTADSLLEEYPNEKLLLPLTYRLAESLEFNNEHDLGMNYYRKCYEIANLQGNSLMLNKIDLKLGNIERVTQNFYEADKYYRKALSHLDMKSKDHRYSYFETLISIFGNKLKLGKHSVDELNSDYDKLSEILSSINADSQLTRLYNPCYDLMVEYALKIGDTKKLKTLQGPSFIEMMHQTSNLNILQGRLFIYGMLAFENEEFQKAEMMGRESWKIAQQFDNIDMKVKALELKTKIHINKLEYEKALISERLKNELAWDLVNINRINHMDILKEEFETKEKQLRIQHLTKRNMILLIMSLFLIVLVFISSILFYRSREQYKIISNQNTKLAELNSYKDLIFAIIGHDLRKPAISFGGMAKKLNYLIQEKEYDTLNQFGQQIEENAIGLNKITDNLLNWALLQRQSMPYNPQLVELSSVIDDAISIFKIPINEKQIQILNKVRTGSMVYADRNALNTIFLNLLDNGIKYTEKKGQIKIEAQQIKNFSMVNVSDNGIGMDPMQVEKMFELKNIPRTEGTIGEKGTGLGLHLVKKLVELNQGSIKAMSTINVGTTFEISLPSRKRT